MIDSVVATHTIRTDFTQLELSPVGSLRDQSSSTRVCLKRTPFIPWELICFSAAVLRVLSSVCVCHPELLWTRWIGKNKAKAQNQCSLEYRSHCDLSKWNIEITFYFFVILALYCFYFSPFITCYIALYSVTERVKGLFLYSSSLAFSVICDIQRSWEKTFIISWKICAPGVFSFSQLCASMSGFLPFLFVFFSTFTTSLKPSFLIRQT